MAELRVLFIGSGAVNFGGAEGPWDHSRRLEQLGGVKFVAIADPDLPKAQDVLKRKLGGPRGDIYRDCKVYADYKDALAATKPDVAFIGRALLTFNTTFCAVQIALYTLYRYSTILSWKSGSTTRH